MHVLFHLIFIKWRAANLWKRTKQDYNKSIFFIKKSWLVGNQVIKFAKLRYQVRFVLKSYKQNYHSLTHPTIIYEKLVLDTSKKKSFSFWRSF